MIGLSRKSTSRWSSTGRMLACMRSATASPPTRLSNSDISIACVSGIDSLQPKGRTESNKSGPYGPLFFFSAQSQKDAAFGYPFAGEHGCVTLPIVEFSNKKLAERGGFEPPIELLTL